MRNSVVNAPNFTKKVWLGSLLPSVNKQLTSNYETPIVIKTNFSAENNLAGYYRNYFYSDAVMIAVNFRTGGIFPLLIAPIVLAAGIYVMYRTTMRYKKVAIDDSFLYVSNYRKEITIPVSNIGDVTEIKWVRTRPITIHLKNASEFGRKIVFTPKPNGFRIFAANPIVAELKELGKTDSNE